MTVKWTTRYILMTCMAMGVVLTLKWEAFGIAIVLCFGLQLIAQVIDTKEEK